MSAATQPAAPDAAFGTAAALRRAQLVGWAVFAVLDVTTRLTVYDSPGAALGLSALLVPLILSLAVLMRAAFDRLKLDGRVTLPALPWIIGLSVAAALVVVGAGHALRTAFGLELAARTSTSAALVSFVYYVMVFLIWSLVCFWIQAELARLAEGRRAAQAEALAMRAEIERLRLQLDPHFLFNTLNGIAEEIPDNPAAALAMLRDLSVFLRRSLAGRDMAVVTVAEEHEALSAWLRVQQARFGDRLRARIAIAPDAASRRIPSLLLQPLLENAIEHGRRDPAIEMHMAVRAVGEVLVVEVANAGTLAGATRRDRGGVGLENVRRRLGLHYPGRHDFALEQDRGMVVARLTLAGEPCSAS